MAHPSPRNRTFDILLYFVLLAWSYFPFHDPVVLLYFTFNAPQNRISHYYYGDEGNDDRQDQDHTTP